MTSADSERKQQAPETLNGNEPTPEELAAIEFETDERSEAGSSEIEQLREEVALNLDRYQRAVADLANYRRRKEQEVMRVGTVTRRAVLSKFLPVVDDFERALGATDDDETAAGWVEGFKLIDRKLWSVLESEGVKPMETVGKPFDPNFHDAVQVDSDVENPDTVVEEFARGFMIGDDVLRPAMVKVGAAENESQESE